MSSEVLPSDIFTFDDNNEQSSPQDALFPPALSFPGLDDFDANSYLSPTSLSPHSSGPSHSSLSPPPTYDSPNSNTSFTDEYLLNNSFGSDELDMLIFPEDAKPDIGHNAFSFPLQNPTIMVNSAYDIKPPQQVGVKPMMNQSHVPTAPMGAIQPPAPSFDGLLQQWRMDLSQNANANPPWMVQAPPQAAPMPNAQAQSRPAPIEPTAQPMSKENSGNHPPPRRSAPNAPINKPLPSPPVNVGKHNKTERRYRQKVQQAQADLRDAVPALRVLYGTSNEEQKMTTDIRAPDGTVDGLGEVTRPNASAKATILIGARMYIELLQRRTAMLQRKSAELEAWRAAVSGQQDLDIWRADFESREAVLAAQLAAIAQAKEDALADAESDDEEEEAAPKKRKRTTKAAAKPTKAAESKTANGVRTFAAFAVSFSLMPSASKLFKAAPLATHPVTMHSASEVSKNEVITRLPLITAEHGSRLLARALPAAMVPAPATIVDWTVKLLVTLALVFVLGPLVERISRPYQDKSTGAGNILGLLGDLFNICLGNAAAPSQEWNDLAASVVGGLKQPSALVRYHLAARLAQSSSDAYSLALLALLAPEKEQSRRKWDTARTLCEPDTPLATVLRLPLDEASHCLELAPPTAAPIASIAEQINLVDLYDLYARFFAHLVAATGSATALPPMLQNIKKSGISGELKSFDREIRGILRGVPRHSSAHALSLVLLGLWGLFSGYQSPATLVSALAAEEVQGAGASLASVSALLELLYPGSSNPQTNQISLSVNAQAIDKLAMSCIGFIDLLFSSSQYNKNAPDRLESNLRVQKEAARLRLVITQANFIGLDEEDDVLFDSAKQKLVSVLCTVGRRAAGRGVRDDDSGIEDELDSW